MRRLFFLTAFLFISTNAQDKITIGTKVAEPFVIKTQDGRWDGIAFDLWKSVSSELNLKYDVKEYDLEGLISAVEEGDIDVAVSPLTITANREEKMDFTLPYLVTGLSIAVIAKEKNTLIGLAKRVFSYEFISVIGALILLLFLIGIAVWLFERRKNPEEFGDGKTKGLWSSFWFAAVTMTTVGYGDKAPKTTGGKIVALVWMFAAIIIISSVTAAISSALTVGQLDTKIKGLNDLYGTSVGTIKESSAENFLIDKKLNYIYVETVEEGLKLVAEKELDAFVYDEPIMKHLIKKQNLSSKIKILPNTLEPVYYGFALPTNSKMRENINIQIIKHISAKKWEEVLYRYLGE